MLYSNVTNQLLTRYYIFLVSLSTMINTEEGAVAMLCAAVVELT